MNIGLLVFASIPAMLTFANILDLLVFVSITLLSIVIILNYQLLSLFDPNAVLVYHWNNLIKRLGKDPDISLIKLIGLLSGFFRFVGLNSTSQKSVMDWVGAQARGTTQPIADLCYPSSKPENFYHRSRITPIKRSRIFCVRYILLPIT